MKEIGKLSKGNELEAVRKTLQAETGKNAEDINDPLQTEKTSVAADKINVSDRATGVGKLVEKVKGVPDVRLEKVAEFREKINTGNYKPTSEEIADAILKSEI